MTSKTPPFSGRGNATYDAEMGGGGCVCERKKRKRSVSAVMHYTYLLLYFYIDFPI